MIIVLQVVGGLAVLLGLAAAIYGIPIQEFSFGNTLIQAGTVGFCTGLILLGLSVVATELRQLSRRLPSGPRPAGEPRPRAALPSLGPAAAGTAPDGGPLFPRDQPALPPVGGSPAEPSQVLPGAPPAWRDERARPDAPPQAPEAAEAKPRRNLLFSSSVRKDRDRQAPATDAPMSDPRVPPAIEPSADANEAPPPNFEDAWPKADRARPPEAPLPRRANRMPPPMPADAGTAAAERAPPAAPGGVTVVKSGVVNGMHYSFYSDGSIEAQLTEGTMRFASFEDLMAHIGQRS